MDEINSSTDIRCTASTICWVNTQNWTKELHTKVCLWWLHSTGSNTAAFEHYILWRAQIIWVHSNVFDFQTLTLHIKQTAYLYTWMCILITAFPMRVAPKKVQNGIRKWPQVIPARSNRGFGIWEDEGYKLMAEDSH